jgi:RNase P protein component
MASAVERNRIRRRLREAARGLGEHGGFDLVLSTDATALKIPFGVLCEQVRTAARAAVERARAAEPPAAVVTAAGRRAGRRQSPGEGADRA